MPMLAASRMLWEMEPWPLMEMQMYPPGRPAVRWEYEGAVLPVSAHQTMYQIEPASVPELLREIIMWEVGV